MAFSSGNSTDINKSSQPASKEIQINDISINDEEIHFTKSGQAQTIEFKVSPQGVDASSVILVSDNTDVAEFRENILVSVAEGETFIYAVCEEENVESNKVKVIVDIEEEKEEDTNIVVDKEETKAENENTDKNPADISEATTPVAAPEASAETVTNPPAAQTAETAPVPEEEPEAVNEPEKTTVPQEAPTNDYNSSPVSEGVVNDAPVSDNTSRIVYIGKTGTKYHTQSCGTLKGGGIPISLDEALAQGRDACARCGG